MATDHEPGPGPERLDDLLFTSDVAPETPAVFMDDRVVTRAALERSARALAAVLAEGAAPRARVGVMLPNSPEAVAAWFGIFAADSVVVLFNPRITDVELARLAADTGVAALVTAPDHVDRASSVVPFVVEARELEWVAYGTGGGFVPEIDDDLAIVQFTSGTTGLPKPVPQTHTRMLDLMGRVVRTVSGSGRARPEAMPNLIPVSLSLGAGIYNVLFAFRVGAPVVLMRAFDPEAFARLVARFEIRSVVLPPPAMAMLCDATAIETLDPLRYVRSITAPLPAALARRFHERFGVAVLNGYGQTEIGGEIIGWSAADWREHRDKLGAVGRPHDGVEARVVPAGDGGESDIGELLVRTPQTTRVPEAVADRVDADGWFRTGDLARIDADGFVWIEGRVSDMINRGGLKVVPEEVEDALREAPGVRDVGVVGVADDRLGEVPWAFVVLERGAALEPRVLEEWCRSRVVAYKVPTGFTAVAELPRNEIGKLRRRDLAQTPRD